MPNFFSKRSTSYNMFKILISAPFGHQNCKNWLTLWSSLLTRWCIYSYIMTDFDKLAPLYSVVQWRGSKLSPIQSLEQIYFFWLTTGHQRNSNLFLIFRLLVETLENSCWKWKTNVRTVPSWIKIDNFRSFWFFFKKRKF